MKLATTLADFKGFVKTWADAVRLFEGTGFRYLDFDFYSAAYPGSPFLSADWKRGVEEAAEAAAKLGFTFVQAHSPSYNPMDPAAEHEGKMLALRRSIEACGMLGIPNLVVHSGAAPDLRYPGDREAYFSRAKAFHSALFPEMEKWGVNVLIENIDQGNMDGRMYFGTGAEMREFLEFCGHPLLHACWDTGHANIDGRDQYEEIRTLGGELYGVHIQDNYGRYDDHIAPLTGTLDLDGVMRGLLDTGYGGYFTFEALNLLPPAPHKGAAAPSALLRREGERFLYRIGRHVLERYGCFEE